MQLAVAEGVGCDDDLRSAAVEPVGGVVCVDAAAQLQTAGKGGERMCCSMFVTGAEHDDVPTVQIIMPVELSEISGWFFGDEICLGNGPVTQCGTDDLLDLALV